MSHLKRIAAPKTWPINRKNHIWVTKPKPGPHKLERCITLDFLLKNFLKYAKTTKEVKYILREGKIMVDNKIRRDIHFPVGLFDIITIKDTNENFRLLINKKGKFFLFKIKKDESGIKLRKIINKTILKSKKIQLNLYDGTNKLVQQDTYKVGDTLVLTLNKNEVQDYLKLEKGAIVYIMDGKRIGDIGIVESIAKPSIYQQKITYAKGDEKFETLKKYIFVIGKNKPIISLPENE